SGLYFGGALMSDCIPFPHYNDIPNHLGERLNTGNESDNYYFINSLGWYELKNTTYREREGSPTSQAESWHNDEWKIHASLARPKNPDNPADVEAAKDNIAKALELAIPIATKYRIRALKVMEADAVAKGHDLSDLHKEAQDRKSIVFYYGKHDAE